MAFKKTHYSHENVAGLLEFLLKRTANMLYEALTGFFVYSRSFGNLLLLKQNIIKSYKSVGNETVAPRLKIKTVNVTYDDNPRSEELRGA